ncbi:type II secretion system secretin GspD [Neotabrizicola sp. sgz301269]|uniref:type II secretion system secretin GspD n=1 Tax=Neotabrizicola sp. sgz301269 TaxID=3276282 RepID=UPI00376F8E2E
MFKPRAVALGWVFLAACLAACESPQASRSSGMFGPDGAFGTSGSSKRGTHGVYSGGNPGATQRGTDDFLGDDRSSREGRAIVAPIDGETVQISLVNASIAAAAKVILADTLKVNYVVAEGVEGRITIQTTGPVPKSTLLDLFEASLNANGAILRGEGNVVRIVSGSAGNTSFRIAGPGGVTGSNIMVAPLKFISATEMVKLLEPLTEQGLKVVAEQKRNLLLLSGSPELMESALDALNLFDVDVLQGKSVALVRLRAADPNDVVSELREIFEAEEGGMLNGVVEFVPNPRLGSILIITSRAAYLDKAQRWIRELDQTAAGSSVYLATYPLQNRSASEVAPILTELLGSKQAREGATGDEADNYSAGLTADERMTVAADDTRNALVVRGTAQDHEQIDAILRSLDSPSRQVLLEATIAEVTLNDELQIGTRWFFERGNWDLKFSDLSSGAVSGSNPGFTAVFGVGGADVALSALSGVTDVKVISAPTLMVLDNKEGILQIGDQVPIAMQTSTSTGTGDAPTITQIDYRDTGIILRVKPRIGDGGRVTLEISQEVSDVAANTASGIDSPTIRQRKVQTSVALGNGQTLALGGLVQEGNSVSRSGVPGASKIPVVGNLFGNKKSRKNRTELLILIRPRVVTNDQEALAATQYWRTKLAGSDSILATGLGTGQHTIYDMAN